MRSTERHAAQAVARRAGAIGASRTGSAQAVAHADVTPACSSPASKARDPAIAAYPAHRLLLTLVQRVLARPPKPPALDGLPKAPGRTGDGPAHHVNRSVDAHDRCRTPAHR